MSEGELVLGVEAAASIRSEIERAAGNEVCFLLAVDPQGELHDPRVVARGNRSAVLAALSSFEPGQLVLHNHPSGVLTPSDADLAIAERLWTEGLGFAITNNEASELYLVLAPPEQRRLAPLDLQALDADLEPGGALAGAHPHYEDRPDQRALARLIARLYHREGIGLAEAGTGIGKSVAYLLPAIRWAVQNGERTVVSTNTINLQEQLVSKDLPFLKHALGLPIRYALVKGRSNYVSIRRARLATLGSASLFDEGRASELHRIERWLEATRDGTLSDLSFRPSPEVWDEVASESDLCLRARCPHFESCFYQRSRREAAGADILVVNHHLLFSDLAIRRSSGNHTSTAVLPHYRRLILDEAHNLEDSATRHLGATLSRRGLGRLLRRLEHRGKGVLPAVESALRARASDLLVHASLDLIDQRLRPELESAWKRGVALFAHLEAVAREEPGGMRRLGPDFGEHPIWAAGLEEELSATILHLDTLRSGLQQLSERIMLDEELGTRLEEQVIEIRGAAGRVEGALDALRSTLRARSEGPALVRWLEYRAPSPSAAAEPGNVILSAAPLDLGGVLRESLWDRVPTVVLTSATLATRAGFDFVRSRIGIGDDLRVEEAIHPSPFDFAAQSVLLIPNDLPEPGGAREEEHARATVRSIRKFAERSDGGLFVLFTSYRALRRAAAELRHEGVEGSWPLFVQGEAPRSVLIARFIESGRGILLGTDSFWEGVDIPGRPLRGIVIPKLPFKVPSEPVTSARIEAIEAEGRNSFTHYMLPHAAIRLKQGFGRLIRSATDRGALLLLDGRIVSRSYGSYLLDSLPPARILVAPWQQCIQELSRFYQVDESAPVRRPPPISPAAIESE